MMNIKKIILVFCCVMSSGAIAESVPQNTLSEISEDELATNEASVFLGQKFKHIENGAEPGEDASRMSARLMLDRCMMLNKLKQYQESVEVCNKLITRFRQTPFAGLTPAVAVAHAIQTNNLVQLKKYEAALASYDATIQFLSQNKVEKAQQLMLDGLLEKAAILSELQRFDEEITVYRQIITEFGQHDNSEVQRKVAIAYLDQAYVYSSLDRPKEMLYNYEMLIKKHAASTDTELQDMVARAYNGRGFDYFLRAKKVWTADNSAAIKQLLLAKTDFASSLKLANNDDTKAIVYGNQAYTVWLLGDAQQSETKLKQALLLDGDYIFETTLEDIKQYPTPMDAGFKGLLERLWALQKKQ